jgi:hypothetical protein
MSAIPVAEKVADLINTQKYDFVYFSYTGDVQLCAS